MLQQKLDAAVSEAQAVWKRAEAARLLAEKASAGRAVWRPPGGTRNARPGHRRYRAGAAGLVAPADAPGIRRHQGGADGARKRACRFAHPDGTSAQGLGSGDRVHQGRLAGQGGGGAEGGRNRMGRARGQGAWRTQGEAGSGGKRRRQGREGACGRRARRIADAVGPSAPAIGNRTGLRPGRARSQGGRGIENRAGGVAGPGRQGAGGADGAVRGRRSGTGRRARGHTRGPRQRSRPVARTARPSAPAVGDRNRRRQSRRRRQGRPGPEKRAGRMEGAVGQGSGGSLRRARRA